jgi:hypothetical protein
MHGFMFTPMHVTDTGARMAANSAESSARQARGEVEMLRDDIERLMMICEALWTVVKKEHGYAEDELVALITQIDLRDGQLDGRDKSSHGPRSCPKCGRALSKRRPVCMYCGTPVVQDPFAR